MRITLRKLSTEELEHCLATKDYERVVRAYYHYALSKIKRYNPNVRSWDERDDLNAECMIAVFDACLGYNPEMASFTTYLNYHITNRMVKAVFEKNKRAKILTRFGAISFYHIREKEIEFCRELGVNHATHAVKDKIAKYFKISRKTVDMVYCSTKTFSEVQHYSDKNHPEMMSKIFTKVHTTNVWEDGYGNTTPENICATTKNAHVIQGSLEKGMEHLTDRERQIIRERFFGDKNLKDVGKVIGISSERVRQIEAAALEKLKKHVRLPEGVEY